MQEKNTENQLSQSITNEIRDQFIKAGAGLSTQQAQQAFRKALAGKSTITTHDIDILFEEKRQIVKKSGLLELYTEPMEFGHLGGFGNLKKWLL